MTTGATVGSGERAYVPMDQRRAVSLDGAPLPEPSPTRGSFTRSQT